MRLFTCRVHICCCNIMEQILTSERERNYPNTQLVEFPDVFFPIYFVFTSRLSSPAGKLFTFQIIRPLNSIFSLLFEDAWKLTVPHQFPPVLNSFLDRVFTSMMHFFKDEEAISVTLAPYSVPFLSAIFLDIARQFSI